MHSKYANLLTRYEIPENMFSICEDLLSAILRDFNAEQLNRHKLLSKQLTELEGQIKKVRLNRATDAIDKDTFETAIEELTNRSASVQIELDETEEYLSNLDGHIRDILLTCCNLGKCGRVRTPQCVKNTGLGLSERD